MNSRKHNEEKTEKKRRTLRRRPFPGRKRFCGAFCRFRSGCCRAADKPFVRKDVEFVEYISGNGKKRLYLQIFRPKRECPSPASADAGVRGPPFPQYTDNRSLRGRRRFLIDYEENLTVSACPCGRSDRFRTERKLVRRSCRSQRGESPSQRRGPERVAGLARLLSCGLCLSAAPAAGASPLFRNGTLPLRMRGVGDGGRSGFGRGRKGQIQYVIPAGSGCGELALQY